jgi:hypothetical protein
LKFVKYTRTVDQVDGVPWRSCGIVIVTLLILRIADAVERWQIRREKARLILMLGRCSCQREVNDQLLRELEDEAFKAEL